MEPRTDLAGKEKIRAQRSAGWRRGLAVFGLFWYALLGWLRLYETLEYRDYLTKLNIWPRPVYILASGLAIGLTFTIAIFLLLFKAKIAPIFMRALGGLFLAWLWFDHIWFSTLAEFYSQVLVLGMITAATFLIMFGLVKNGDYCREEIHGNQ